MLGIYEISSGIHSTSTRATKAAAIMAKHSPASKVGAPHWNGYGTLILQNVRQ
jgi:hypothetical protein